VDRLCPGRYTSEEKIPALDGPENRSGCLEEEKNLFVLPGIEICLSLFLLQSRYCAGHTRAATLLIIAMINENM